MKLKQNQIVTLSSSHFKLTISPAFGCHWMSLNVKSGGVWNSILKPVASCQELMKHPMEAGAFFMIPWCNRITKARFIWDQKTIALKANFSDGSAIHGDVYRQVWNVEYLNKSSVITSFDSRRCSEFNFPFPVKCQLTHTCEDTQLNVDLTIHNLSDQTIPLGAGFHPFFNRYLNHHHDKPLKMNLPHQYMLKQAGPFPKPDAVTKLSISRQRQWMNLKNTFLDHTFFKPKANLPIQLSYKNSPVQLDMYGSAPFQYAFIYSPRTHGGKKADFTCVEPMTMLPGGFHFLSSDQAEVGGQLLGPQQTIKLHLRISLAYPI